MNNDNFLIEDSDLDLAKIVCNEIKESTVRNRAVANVLAADIAKKYFTENFYIFKINPFITRRKAYFTLQSNISRRSCTSQILKGFISLKKAY